MLFFYILFTKRIYFWPYLFPIIFVLIYFVVKDVNSTAAIPNICPNNQLYYGPCIAGQCPPDCPVVCTCIGRRDCCTTLGGGGNGSNNGDGGSISSNLLTRLLLALLLTSPSSNIGVPKARLSLVICRDLALNCALYTFYCALPVYALCMRANCAATCGLCNDGGGLLGMPLLLSLLGFNDLNRGNTRNQLISPNTINSNNQLPQPAQNAIRSGAPPIREENDDDDEEDKTTKTKVENNFVNISIQNSFGGNFNKRKEAANNNNNPTTNYNKQPLQFAIPPGLQVLDHQKIREQLIKLGAI